MSQLSALTVLAIIFAVASMLSTKTKARVSMMFICTVIFLVAFWNGLPKTIFADSGMQGIATPFISLLMVQMGTMMDAHKMKSEWKTVAVSFIGMCAGAAGILLIAAPFIGWQYAVAATGPVSGGVVAGLIMNGAADAKGLKEISVFITMLLTVQGLFGVPVASNCLLQEGKRLKARFAAGERASGTADAPEMQRRHLIPMMPERWRNSYVYLAKAFIVCWLSIKAAGLCNNVVHPFVMALIFGIVANELGFLETNIMSLAEASGMVMFVIMVPIYAGLVNATPQMVIDLLVPMLIVFGSTLVGIGIVSWPMAKIFGYSWSLSTALGSTCLFGFPGTLIITEEVAAQVAESPEEREFIMGQILPKMLIAGFTTVTVASVFLAAFLVRFF